MTEWNASDYALHSTLQKTLATEHLALVALTGGERVLDVGCGDGKVTAAVAARVPRGAVLGVDPSRDMIAFAAAHFSAADYPNLTFAVGDARNLPYRAEFDLVISFNALHWVLEQDRALRSIHAALKPGGRAVLRFVPAGPRRALEDVIEEARSSPRWARCFLGFQRPYVHPVPADFRDMARAVGFAVVRLHTEDRAWDFQTRAEFAAFLRATCFAWTRNLPEGDWDEFFADVLDRYRAVAATGAGDENTFKFYQMDVELVREV